MGLFHSFRSRQPSRRRSRRKPWRVDPRKAPSAPAPAARLGGLSPGDIPIQGPESPDLEQPRLQHYKAQLLQHRLPAGRMERFKRWASGGRYRSTYDHLIHSVDAAANARTIGERRHATNQMKFHTANWHRKHGNEGAQSHAIDNTHTYDQERVRSLLDSGEIDKGTFHGTHSGLFTGLGESGGVLKSAKQVAEDQGTLQTGEGDMFTPEGGLKSEIFVGKGNLGFGTASAYADANHELPHYNPGLMTNRATPTEENQLQARHDMYNGILEIAAQRKQTGRKLKKIPGTPKENGLRVIETERDKWATELEKRRAHEESLGSFGKGRLSVQDGDAAHLGTKHGTEHYPLMFEFEGGKIAQSSTHEAEDDLDLQPTQNTKPFDTFGDGSEYAYPLAGEMTTTHQIDLKKRVKRVYAPRDRLSHAHSHMRSILGQGVPFEVVAMEGLGGVDPAHEAHLAKKETMDDMRSNATGSDAARKSWIQERRESQAQ